jgi:hypothetical protein
MKTIKSRQNAIKLERMIFNRNIDFPDSKDDFYT